jgi:hypothetical protein
LPPWSGGAALEFVAELDPALAPRLLAADTALADPHGSILVLEDKKAVAAGLA